MLADPLVLEKERYALLYLTKRRVALKDLSFTLIIPLFLLKLTYRQVATNETHSHCYQPLVRKCDGEPLTSSNEEKNEVCKDWPETFCTTQYVENNEGQFVADTKCERIHTELCVPVNCDMVPGPEKCHEQVVPSIHEVPEEVNIFY